MEFRYAKSSDAEALCRLMEHVENNSEYMLYDPGERKITIEGQKKMIEALNKQSNSCIIVAEDESDLVGYLFAIGGQTTRTLHRAYLVIGIHTKFRGKGIGSSLFKQLDDWALYQGIHRLELTVVTKNDAGVSLYKKAGFKIEGVKKDSLMINNSFVDEYYMAKWFNGGDN